MLYEKKKIYKLQFLFRRFEIQEKRNYKQLYAENGKINNNLYLKFLNNYWIHHKRYTIDASLLDEENGRYDVIKFNFQISNFFWFAVTTSKWQIRGRSSGFLSQEGIYVER